MPNAVIYCRVSTARQAEEGTSLDTQERACQRYCEERGYTVLAVYRDDHTGAELDRPGLRALRKDVRSGRAQVVVAYALDRVSRNQSHIAVLLYEWEEEHEARLELVTEDLDNSPIGRFIRSALGFVADIEREKIAERSGRGLRERVMEKHRPRAGAKPPYGFKWSGEKKSFLVEDPETAPIVRRIYRDVAAGVTLLQLALDLTDEGVPPPSAHLAVGTKRPVASIWRRGILSRIVKNPAYKGEFTAHRHVVLKKRVYDPMTQETRIRKRVVRNTEGGVVLPDVCTALVSEDVWSAANARLQLNKASAARNNRYAEGALLRAGFAVCGDCGSPLAVVNRRGKLYYRCGRTNNEEARTNPCPAGYAVVSAEALDRVVWEETLVPALLDPDNVRRVVEAYLKMDIETDEQSQYTAVEALLERAKETHTGFLQVAALAQNEFTRQSALESAEKAALDIRRYTDELADLQHTHEAERFHKQSVKTITQWATQMQDRQSQFTYQQKRTVLFFANATATVYFRTPQGKRWSVKHDFTPYGLSNCVQHSNLLWTQVDLPIAV